MSKKYDPNNAVGNNVLQVEDRTAVLISTGRYTINATMEIEKSAQDVYKLIIRSAIID